MLVINSISSGQYAVALKEGQALLKERPKDVALLNNVAWLYDRTGNVPKAIELAEQALAQAPASAEINDTLGWLLVRNSKLERGLGLLKKGHELAPKNPEIGYHYAVALNQSGKAAEAKTVVVDALKNPQNFAERPDAEKFMQSLK
jgi:Flp pilus assembly protein TadD